LAKKNLLSDNESEMKEVTVGIDIGGTYTKYGIVEKNGECSLEGKVDTNAYESITDFVADLHQIISNRIKQENLSVDIKGVGIGAPNGNYYSGTIEHAANLKWKGIVPLSDLFKEYFKNIPVTLTNDANAAALGEMMFGGGRGCNNFIVITLGTGLGSGIVVNGQLLYGHSGFAGEMGHITTEVNGRRCGYGRQGSLETYVSATGIKRTAFELMASSIEKSALRDYSYNQLTSQHIFKYAMDGDFLALKCFERTAKILGNALANAIAVLSPEKIFLLGGLAKAGDLLIKPTKKYMEEHVLPVFKDQVSLQLSGLQHINAAILGAGALAWNEIEQSPHKQTV